MSDTTIVKHCSPTLAGLKTASLFACSFDSEKKMRESLLRWNRLFVRKGLRVITLRYRDGKALIYLFRPDRLYRDLDRDDARALLSAHGYCPDSPKSCLLRLRERLGESEEFPHEIGLFLGYPPEDVCGFIENRAGGCKCAGCWKVYGDIDAAKKQFARYKKCTGVYCAKLKDGHSIEKLTVDSSHFPAYMSR